MADLFSQIRQRAKELGEGRETFDGCLWTEQIPRFFRGEIETETEARLRAHMEGCDECATLLMALSAQQKPAPRYRWLADGIRYILQGTISLLSGERMLQPALRASGTEYDMLEWQIELPNDDTLCVRVIAHGTEKAATVFSEGGRTYGYDLLDAKGQLLKSVDGAEQLRFGVPDTNFSLVVDGTYAIRFGGDPS